MLVVASKYRLKVTGVVLLATVFFFITVIPANFDMAQEDRDSRSYSLAFFVIYSGVTAAMLIIAPVNSLLKRLLFLALGLILLVALNVLSDYASDLREWLKPPAAS
jgi:hypothetical protein